MSVLLRLLVCFRAKVIQPAPCLLLLSLILPLSHSFELIIYMPPPNLSPNKKEILHVLVQKMRADSFLLRQVVRDASHHFSFF